MADNYSAMSHAELVELVRARDDSMAALKNKTKEFVAKTRAEKTELQTELEASKSTIESYTSKLMRAKELVVASKKEAADAREAAAKATTEANGGAIDGASTDELRARVSELETQLGQAKANFEAQLTSQCEAADTAAVSLTAAATKLQAELKAAESKAAEQLAAAKAEFDAQLSSQRDNADAAALSLTAAATKLQSELKAANAEANRAATRAEEAESNLAAVRQEATAATAAAEEASQHLQAQAMVLQGHRLEYDQLLERHTALEAQRAAAASAATSETSELEARITQLGAKLVEARARFEEQLSSQREAADAHAASLSAQVTKLQGELHVAKDEAVDAAARAGGLQGLLQQAKDEAAAAKVEVVAAEAAAKEASMQHASATAEFEAKLKSARGTTEAAPGAAASATAGDGEGLKAAQIRADELESQLKASRDETKSVRAEMETASALQQARFAETREQLETERRNATEARAALESERQNAVAANATAEALMAKQAGVLESLAEAQQAAKRAQAVATAATEERDSANSELAAVRAQLAELEKQGEAFQAGLAESSQAAEAEAMAAAQALTTQMNAARAAEAAQKELSTKLSTVQASAAEAELAKQVALASVADLEAQLGEMRRQNASLREATADAGSHAQARADAEEKLATADACKVAAEAKAVKVAAALEAAETAAKSANARAEQAEEEAIQASRGGAEAAKEMAFLRDKHEAELEAVKRSVATQLEEALRAKEDAEGSAADAKARDEEHERRYAELQGKLARQERELEAEKELGSERKKQVLAYTGSLNDDKKKLIGQLSRAKQIMEEANRKESELRERLRESESNAASTSERLRARVLELEAALKESEEKHHAVFSKVQGHSAELDRATEEMAHHKSKRLVAKNEMIAMAKALEAERELRKHLNAHMITSATPTALEQAASLETQLALFEDALVSLSRKVGRPYTPLASVPASRAAGVRVGVGNPLQSHAPRDGSPDTPGSSKRPSVSNGSNGRKDRAGSTALEKQQAQQLAMMREAEQAQLDRIANFEAEMARVTAGLGSLQQGVDVLGILVSEQSLVTSLRVACSAATEVVMVPVRESCAGLQAPQTRAGSGFSKLDPSFNNMEDNDGMGDFGDESDGDMTTTQTSRRDGRLSITSINVREGTSAVLS